MHDTEAHPIPLQSWLQPLNPHCNLLDFAAALHAGLRVWYEECQTYPPLSTVWTHRPRSSLIEDLPLLFNIPDQ